ncbi:MAG: DNA-directed RNA polymerase subunit omega [Muribaculaceae bacterium]|nr:DNA-directed RNA polymerase subunit omega [Muribaculaceae bacterium]
MDYKKVTAPINTVTRDIIKMSEDTENIYETVCIIGKRANQISSEMKQELQKKLEDFKNQASDTNEEITENREQIEISRFYEKLPKPTLIATEEYIEHKVFFRESPKDKASLD